LLLADDVITYNCKQWPRLRACNSEHRGAANTQLGVQRQIQHLQTFASDVLSKVACCHMHASRCQAAVQLRGHQVHLPQICYGLILLAYFTGIIIGWPRVCITGYTFARNKGYVRLCGLLELAFVGRFASHRCDMPSPQSAAVGRHGCA
jgi:hypothetical protein